MLIELQSVSKTYAKTSGSVQALREVDLQIGTGEYVAILGPSGSGKSTLLQLLGCLDTPTAGTYRLDGTPIHELDRNALAETRNQKIGFVFQRFHLMPRATALENVALPLRFANWSQSRRNERAQDLLKDVGLADRTTHFPSELSGGQQQRVAIARALANHPPLILADEPTGNLDSQSGTEITQLLEGLRDEGRTIILVTHDEQLASRTDRIIRLLDGRIVGDDRTS